MCKQELKKVVITGVGPVTSIGIGKDKFWENLVAGKSGISEVSFMDTEDYERHFAGEIKDFDPSEFIKSKKLPHLGRAAQLGLTATNLAISDSGLDLESINKAKMGVICGTTVGELQLLEAHHNNEDVKENPIDKMMHAYPSSSISTTIANDLGLGGSVRVFTTACAAGNYSLGQAYDLIKLGKMDVMLAGGADAYSRVIFTGFSRLFSIAPQKCQPYSKNRQGMIPGEGAGILVVESLDHALDRGAHIYSEVLGYGLSSDGQHMTNPSSEGISKAMKKAIKQSNLKPDDIDYVNTHGTGTKENDKAECEALRIVFNGRLDSLPISSIKSMLGHTMGAASAIESIACCLALENNEIPPTINFEEKDEECEVDCVPNKSRKINLKTILNSSQAFGGNNASVILIGR